MTVNDNYHAVAIRACDFNMIGSDECQVVAAKIHTGQMSKWHFAWLIPAEIVCNLGAILLSVVSALAHVIMGVALTIFAACTGDAEKKFQYNLRAAEHFASSLSAITDKVGTSFVRLVMPTTAAYSCVKDSIYNSLFKGHIKNYLYEQVISGLQQSMQRQGMGHVPTHQIDSVLHPILEPLIDQAIDNGEVEQLPGRVQALLPQALLPQLMQDIQNAPQNRGQQAGGPQMQPEIPQGPQVVGPNWGGMPPMRPGQNQPMNFGGGVGFGGAQGHGFMGGNMPPQMPIGGPGTFTAGFNPGINLGEMPHQPMNFGGGVGFGGAQGHGFMGGNMPPQMPIGGPGTFTAGFNPGINLGEMPHQPMNFGGGVGFGGAQGHGFMGQNMPPQIPIGGPGTFPTGFGFGGAGQQSGQEMQRAQQRLENFQRTQQQIQQARTEMEQAFHQGPQTFSGVPNRANQNFGMNPQQNAPEFPPTIRLGNSQLEAQVLQVFQRVASGAMDSQAARQQIVNQLRGSPQDSVIQILQMFDAMVQMQRTGAHAFADGSHGDVF